MLKISLCAALFGAPLPALPALPLPPTPADLIPAPVSAPLVNSIPDVRGLEYREVTLEQFIGVSIGNFQGSVRRVQPPAIHLWVLPAQNGEARRGVGWNGVEYELESVGNLADWRADVEARLKPRVDGQEYFLPRAFEFSGGAVSQWFLERLSAPELKRRARLQASSFPFGSNSNDPDTEYLYSLRDAGVSSFAGGDFEQAKRQLQTLSAVLPPETPRNAYNPRAEATTILADIARRETDVPRPTEEIAGLIWDLQNLRSFGGWTQNRTVQKLVDLGDRAVEPLLDALENDDRLTLAVRVNMFRAQRFEPLATVRDAAQGALDVLLKHHYYSSDYRLKPAEQQRQIASQMRADWNKVKGQTPTERVFKILSQSGQTPERLEEAARELVRGGKPYGSNISYGRVINGVVILVPEPQTLFGEPLRNRRNPSVSDLLEARILELSSRALNGKPMANALDPTLPDNINAPDAYALNRAMRAANALALFAVKWEPKRGAALLGAQLERAKTFAAKSPRGVREDAENGVQSARRGFLTARLDTPFRAAALREYGAFLKSQPFGRFREADYVPLWRFASEPAMIEATKSLFSAPLRPFQAAATGQISDSGRDTAFQLLYSPMVRIPVVKAAIARELANRTVIGQVRARENGTAEVVVTAFNWNGPTLKMTTSRLENGAFQPLPVCDLVGFRLMEKRIDSRHLPRFTPLLDLSLPRAKRDARLKEIAALLAQNQVASNDFGFENAN